jgi:hypothetical protein
MFSFSIPTLLTGVFVAGGISAVTVSVALPALNELNADPSAVTSTSTQTPTPTGWPTGSPDEDQEYSPDDLAVQDINSSVAPGLSMSNLPMGINVIHNSSGVVFTFRGICTDPSGFSRVISNTGFVQSSGGVACTVGKETSFANSTNWDVYTKNAYCSSFPNPGSSAYRLEAHGQVSQWANIPEEFKICESNVSPPSQVIPEGPSSSPVTPSAPENVEPAPSDSPPSPGETPAG